MKAPGWAPLFFGVFIMCAALACQRKPPPHTASARAPVARAAEASPDDPQPVALPPCGPAGQGPANAHANAGVLRVRLSADPPHLDPLDETGDLTAQVLVGLVHEPVLSCRSNGVVPQTFVQPASGVVARWELVPAQDGVTLHVRPGTIFHDGRAVTSADLRASIDAVWRGGARMPHVRAALVDLAGMDTPSAAVLHVRFKRPSPLSVRALCEVPVVAAAAIYAPRRKVDAPANGAAVFNGPVGTGPFRFAGWSRGKSIRLVRFAQPGRPLAALTEINFEIESSTGRALGRLRRGELHVLPILDAIHFPEQVRPAALGQNSRLLALQGTRHTFVAINHRRAPLSTPIFRRALSLLWDRAGLADELHHGLVQAIVAPPFASLPAPALDVALASQLLRDSGILPPASASKRAPPIAARLSLLHSGSRTPKAELRRYAERLRRLGILLELVPVDHAQLVERVQSGQFDLALVSWQGPPQEDPRPRFAARGLFNLGGFESPGVDSLLEELRTHDGPQSRATLDQRLGQLLAEDLPAIFLYRHTELAVASAQVRGLCNQGGILNFAEASLAP